MSSTGTPASDSTETNECRNSRGVHSFGSRGPGAAPFGSPAGRWLVRTHAQGLTDQVSQADRSSYLGVGGSTLDSHDMWIVRRELSRILDDNDPILLRHQRQQSGKQSRLAALVPPQSSTVCQASALPQRVTTRAPLSHQLDRNSGGRTRQISAQI